ncbi:hypothetical protein [Nocardia asteroides]|uniref:hypothetical protein n=1 Tax=Nocardia asteroides TaxID=1824 RepID=UPI00341AB92C
MLKLLDLIRGTRTAEDLDGSPMSAGRLGAGDVVIVARRGYRVISTSFADDTRRAGRVVADTADLVTGRLRVLYYPSADTIVTVKAA